MICPVSMAVLMPQSAPPVSRTVVKPRSSMARNRVTARAVTRVSGNISMKRTLTSLWIACTWQSISPGINVRLPQLMTIASVVLIGLSLSSLTVSPSASNSYPPRSSPNEGSSNSKFLNRICWDIADSLQPVLVEAPALHDDRKVLAFLLKQLQVLERVAIDNEQIGKSAWLQAAKLALHAHDLGADRGGRTDDVDRRQHPRAERELLRLRHLQLTEQIGAVCDRDAVTLADFERLQGAVDDEVVLGQHVRAHAVFGGMLLHFEIGDEIGNEEHTLLGHQPGGRIVDKIAMLNGTYAGVRRARYGLRRIGVSTDIAAEGVRLLHGSHHFVYRELQAIERIVGRGDAAGHHDLHMVATLAHFLAHRAADFGNAIRDAHGE